VLTRDRGPEDWAVTFLDTVYRLPTAYSPTDLVRTNVAGGGSVRRHVAADLRAMVRAAATAGAPVKVVSAYRSYGTQVYDFAYWVRVSGLASALLGSARPGHSEHQLGTTIDVTSLGAGLPWLMWDWGTTPAGRWMRLNAWRYGFVMSYPPKGSPAKTCYRYEPWHFRYVGKEMAAAVRASGLTLREYLWRNRAP
jgi:zinc D-Ala-D-Ala carboxypeptidase